MGLQRRRNWYGDVPTTDADKREAVEQFLRWRFPALDEIGQLRKQLALIRSEAAELHRRGFAQDALNLKFEAVKLSGKIDELENSLKPTS